MILRTIFLTILISGGIMLSAAQRPQTESSKAPIASTLQEESPWVKEGILARWFLKRLDKKLDNIKKKKRRRFNVLGLLGASLTISSSIIMLSAGIAMGSSVPIFAVIGFILGTILAIVSLVQIASYKRRRGVEVRPKVLSYLALLPLLGLIVILGAFLNS